jgi:hypothetical protein
VATGRAAAADGGTFLLVDGRFADSPASQQWLQANGPAIIDLRLSGGPDVLSSAVEVAALLDAVG